MGLVSYNRADPEQNAFLAAVRNVEGSPGYNTGVGYVDLSNAKRDQYGFPIWDGKYTSRGPTHAAGAYQFQPGTWKAIAAKFGLNFASASDQDEGAWYNAQQVYAAKTGSDLDADLDAGLFNKVQLALSSEWEGIKLKPGAFLSAMKNGASAELAEGATDTSGTPSLLTSPVEAAKSYFVRGGMMLTGAVILVVALWALLKSDAIGKLAT